MRRILVVILLLAALPAGCRNPRCCPENIPVFQKQSSPLDTLEYVIYLARNGCGERLYQATDATSREQISEVGFKLFWQSAEYPRWGVPIVNLVKGMRPDHPRWPVVVVQQGNRARLMVLTIFLDEERRFREELMEAILYEEEGKWKVNLEETARAN